jgi:hypothetical protein
MLEGENGKFQVARNTQLVEDIRQVVFDSSLSS